MSKELDDELEIVSKLLDEELKKLKTTPNYNMKGSSNYRTICSVLRDIYHNTEDEKIKEWSVEATIMAKKMTKVLVKHKLKEIAKQQITTKLKETTK